MLRFLLPLCFLVTVVADAVAYHKEWRSADGLTAYPISQMASIMHFTAGEVLQDEIISNKGVSPYLDGPKKPDLAKQFTAHVVQAAGSGGSWQRKEELDYFYDGPSKVRPSLPLAATL
ncbi:hypothetical protein CYMTET_12730, partial [Cymbomonas tetramitiformis]